MIVSSYLTEALTGKGLNQIVARVAKRIKETVGLDSFDAIAFRGMSGALVAPLLAANLNKNLIMVRKEKVTHSCYVDVEGDISCDSYIIVDDAIETGGTVNIILEKLSKFFGEVKKNPKCLGVFLYRFWYQSGQDIPIDIIDCSYARVV